MNVDRDGGRREKLFSKETARVEKKNTSLTKQVLRLRGTKIF